MRTKILGLSIGMIILICVSAAVGLSYLNTQEGAQKEKICNEFIEQEAKEPTKEVVQSEKSVEFNEKEIAGEEKISEDKILKEELLLSNYPDAFKNDTIIIIGNNASQIEKECAEAIAAQLRNITKSTPIIKSNAVLTDDNKTRYNLIIAGTPRSNSLLQEIYNLTNATELTEEYPGVNKGVLEILWNPWNEDKVILLVEGNNERGVKAAVLNLSQVYDINETIAIVELEESEDKYTIFLSSRQFVPTPGISPDTRANMTSSPLERVHVLIQFYHIPNATERHALENVGVNLLTYVHNYAWFASIPSASVTKVITTSPTRWIGEILPEDKISPYIQENNFGDWAINPDGTVNLIVEFFSDVSLDNAEHIIESHDGVANSRVKSINALVVAIPQDVLTELANEDGVQWIGQVSPLPVEELDQSRPLVGGDTVQAPPYNLNGAGVRVLVYDGRNVCNTHPDLGNRVIWGETSSVSDHATHVAGIIAGNGSIVWILRGMAPSAEIISYDDRGNWHYENPGDLENEYDEAINTHGIDIASNSWGTPVKAPNCLWMGDYNPTAQLLDAIAGGSLGKAITIVFSVGNERNDGDCGTDPGNINNNYACVNPPHPAKNIIAVGAINSNDDSMTKFSSWGPVDDGRIKPDVVAPGCQVGGDGGINSTMSNWEITPYETKCGTSMSAPHVSGSAALMLQCYRNTHDNVDPWLSTIKALSIHTAVDLGNLGPDYSYGYGRINVQDAVDMIRDDATCCNVIVENTISAQSEMDNYIIEVPAGASELKVTLVWIDEPGTPNDGLKELVNDLDLILKDPNGVRKYPWTLDPSEPQKGAERNKRDDLNNVEQVYVSNPIEGTWKITVNETILPEPIQNYSLVSSLPVREDDIPVIELTPPSHDFGNVEVGGCSPTADFTVENIGTGTATGSVYLTGSHADQFTITTVDKSFSLAEGATKTITVEFCPGSVGAKTATLFAKGTNCNDDSSSLSGTGTQPPSIDLSPQSYGFGNMQVGQCSSEYSFTLTNTGGGTAMGSVSLTGTHATQFTITQGSGSFSLGTGASKTIKVKFCPTSTGAKSATLFADGTNCNDDSSSLEGTGFTPVQPEIQLTPPSHNFGNVKVGECSPTSEFTLENIGTGTATGSVSLTGTHATQFTITQGSGSFSLGTGASKTIKVKFCPGSVGAKTATLFAKGTNCEDDSASLSGTGVQPEIELTPPSHDFGNVEVGGCSPTAKEFTIKNIGTATATGSVYLTGSHADQFTITTVDKSFSLAEGDTKTFTVEFCPGSVGAKTATLFAKGTNCNDDSSSLEGTGFTPVQPEIQLTQPSHNFGNVKVGECSPTSEFTLENIGTGTATGSVSLTGTHATQFTITQGSGSFSLGTGASKTIKVKFCPGSVGAKTATLFAKGTNCEDDSASLSGTGVQPPIANANGPYAGVIEYIAVPITFDGTGSYDPDGTIRKYEWDLDNDGQFDDAFGATPTVSFTAPYSGNIHLKVTDNNGATDTDTTTLTITKHSPPPNGIHGGLLTPPEQPQCYKGTSTIQGKGYFTIDERIQDWATAIDTTEHIEGTGEFEMDSKKVLNQAANTSDFYDPNFHYKKTMQFQGNATNRLISRDKFESSGIFGGTGTRINEYFDVSMIQKDESGSIKTISAPGSGQSHRFATMDDFSGIWGIHSDWQKICQKKITHHQMFIGNFSVQKDLTFEREVVIP